MERPSPDPNQKFIDNFIRLRDKTALQFGKNIFQLSKYEKSHFCTPLCPCHKIKRRQLRLRQKLDLQQAIITDLEDGIFQSAIDYLAEIQTKYQQEQKSFTDNLLLVAVGSRFARIVHRQHLSKLTITTTNKLSNAQDAAYRRLMTK
jgi:hypothetical protein